MLWLQYNWGLTKILMTATLSCTKALIETFLSPGPHRPMYRIYSNKERQGWNLMLWVQCILWLTKIRLAATSSYARTQRAAFCIARAHIGPCTVFVQIKSGKEETPDLGPVHIGAYQNTNDSNFTLYDDPDNSFLSPCIYSKDKQEGRKFMFLVH